MLRGLALIASGPVLALCAQDCAAPPDAVAQLKAYLSYESSVSFGAPGPRRFSFAPAGGDALFLQHGAPGSFRGAQRLVYVSRKGRPLLVAGCPSDTPWTKCAEDELRNVTHDPADPRDRPIGPACELSVTVPEWRPSADSDLKRALASEALQELFEFGYANPRAVYVRDFNVADPELDFYVVGAEGNESLQGCAFDAYRRPHCDWHGFGQSPVEKLKRQIMTRPYKLFPPEAPANRPGR